MRASEFPYFDAPFLALAHRGGATYGPNVGRENSVHAFRSAQQLGYRYVETDVHATADGVLVAFHDTRLDRVTDGHGLVAELPWAALQEVRIGGHDPIPTLAELLETFPDLRFNIDAKAPRAVELLIEAIGRHGASERICVSSFGVGRLHALRRGLRAAGLRVASAASSLGVAWTRWGPGPLPRLVTGGGAALQLPISTTMAGRRVEVLTDRLIARAHATGRQVHVWTVDDRATMAALIDRGVDGIFTDRTDVLKELCQERGLWH